MARPSEKAALARKGGALSKAEEATAVGEVTRPVASIVGGAQAVPHYRDRHEEYELVTRDDLREVRAFGWLQQSLFGVGTFLLGFLWLLIQLLAQQEKFEFTAWMGMYLIGIAAGLVFVGIGLVLFYLKQKRLQKYFPPRNAGNVDHSKSSPRTRSQLARREGMSQRTSRRG
jgi:hypothetical protein